MQVSTIGLDLAKDVFQVHGLDANEMGQGQVLRPIGPSRDAALHSSRAMMLERAMPTDVPKFLPIGPRRRGSASRRCASTSSQCAQLHGSRRSVRDGKTESGQFAVNVTTMLRPIENFVCFMALLLRSSMKAAASECGSTAAVPPCFHDPKSLSAGAASSEESGYSRRRGRRAR